jgi:dTDP-4-amino-4,6-dideoxygalactose transaminase
MQVPLNDLGRVLAPYETALRAACERVLASGTFILGNEVRSFESAFADYCGVPECVGVASGSDALEIALRAVGVRAGDRVATVANAAMYSTLAIVAIGATPVFVDVDDATLTMSARALEAAAASPLRAIVVTHLYGRLADSALVTIAQRIGVPLVEDCAQSHGARCGGTRAGAFGNAGCFSFYPTKNLGAAGDGGAIVFRDPAIAGRARSLRQYGWAEKYRVEQAGGRNSRLDEMQAAMLRARLPSLDRENARRREIVARYATGLRNAAIRAPDVPGEDDVAHLAVVRCAQRDRLRDHLRVRGIGCDVHYPVPDHRQPVFGGGETTPQPVVPAALTVTERACREVLTLPCFPAMTDAEADAVVDACNAWRP